LIPTRISNPNVLPASPRAVVNLRFPVQWDCAEECQALDYHTTASQSIPDVRISQKFVKEREKERER
jgi:hypothetical protein